MSIRNVTYFKQGKFNNDESKSTLSCPLESKYISKVMMINLNNVFLDFLFTTRDIYYSRYC